ncbi:hypothetical protein DFH06DRAFT_1123733 [Mycena polygramma]|nr:hypothetical protein DFH06DRAFT_1123733 [Mycena polygramma]
MKLPYAQNGFPKTVRHKLEANDVPCPSGKRLGSKNEPREDYAPRRGRPVIVSDSNGGLNQRKRIRKPPKRRKLLANNQATCSNVTLPSASTSSKTTATNTNGAAVGHKFQALEREAFSLTSYSWIPRVQSSFSGSRTHTSSDSSATVSGSESNALFSSQARQTVRRVFVSTEDGRGPQADVLACEVKCKVLCKRIWEFVWLLIAEKWE